MTAPLFNLPIMSPAAGASTAAAGQDAATGFEALLATFFGTTGEPLPEALGASQTSDKDAGEQPIAADGQTTPPLSAEAQALAAMLVLPAATVVQTAAPAAEASDNGPTSAPASSASPSPIPFSLPGPAALADQTAPASVANIGAQAAPEADPTALASPEPQPPVFAAATNPEIALPASGQPKEAQNAVKAAPDLPPAATSALNSAPTPASAPSASPALPPPAVRPSSQAPALVSPSVMTQAQAPTEAPLEAELAPPRTPARNTRSADAALRGLAQGAPAAPTDEAVLPTAVTPAANAMAFGQAASSVEAEKVAAPLQVESEAPADVPDAPPAPAAAGPPPPAAHAAPAHNAAPVRATPETVANLTAQISQKLEGHSSKFDIELNPAGLGRVSVSVEIAASGKMTAAMSFDSPQAAAELRARSSEIQRALEQAGFDLSGGLSFDVADRGDGRGAPQQQQNDETAWRGRAFQALLDTTGEAAEAASSLALNHGRRPNAGVDVRI